MPDADHAAITHNFHVHLIAVASLPFSRFEAQLAQPKFRPHIFSSAFLFPRATTR